jgi:hypothetical protein
MARSSLWHRLAVMARICSISLALPIGPLPTASPSAESARRCARSARMAAIKLTTIVATQRPATARGHQEAAQKLTASQMQTAPVADHSASSAETSRVRAKPLTFWRENLPPP